MTTVHAVTQMQTGRFAVLPPAGAQSFIGTTRTRFTVDFMRTAGKPVLQLAGLLDEAAASQLEREVVTLLRRGEKTLVLDMESVEVARKEGVRGILMISTLIEQQGGNLILCGLYGSVGHVFRMYGVDGMFETFENVEEFENQTRSRVTQ